jgi:L-aminopeptidase/D-esterase-like protein
MTQRRQRVSRARDAATYLQENPQVSHAGNLTTATTLVVVATNAALDKTQCGKAARMAQDGLARSVHPAFTSNDGDVVIVLAKRGHVASEDTIEIITAEAVADASRDSVRQATSRGGVPDMHTPGARNLGDSARSSASAKAQWIEPGDDGRRTSRKYRTIPSTEFASVETVER